MKCCRTRYDGTEVLQHTREGCCVVEEMTGHFSKALFHVFANDIYVVLIDCSDRDEFVDVKVVEGFVNEFAGWHKRCVPR